MENELITISTKRIDGEEISCISARELHEFLEIGTRFDKWFGRMCEYGFNENNDFVRVAQKCPTLGGIQTKIDYIITLDMAKEICMMQRKNEKAGSVLEYLLKYNNKEAVVLTKHTYTRFELSFEKQLKEILRPLNIEIETQKPMFGGKYRIDFYLPEFNLAIEYDEEQHKYYQEKDKQREEEIKEELGCRIIRLDYKNSDSYNVGLVLKEIMGR